MTIFDIVEDKTDDDGVPLARYAEEAANISKEFAEGLSERGQKAAINIALAIDIPDNLRDFVGVIQTAFKSAIIYSLVSENIMLTEKGMKSDEERAKEEAEKANKQLTVDDVIRPSAGTYL